jgi:hypothetical protein
MKQLIEDEASEHTDFASQQDVSLWVAQGNQVKHLKNNCIYGFKNGCFCNLTKNIASEYNLLCPEAWQKHTPPPPRLIRVNGVVVHAPLDSFECVDAVYVADPRKILGWECYAPQALVSNGVSLDMCYATKTDAIARAEAMRLFDMVE